MKQFKINGSSCGKIMGVRGLGKTGESFINQKLVEGIFKRKKEFSNKYTQKGNIVENGAITFVDDVLDLGGVIKNEEWFESEHMSGTPDIITDEMVIDIKSSWDCFTFPFFDNDLPNKDYYWQGQTYMSLTGHDRYQVVYVLMDTPQFLIERESFYWCKDNGVEDLDGHILKQFEERMTYNDIDPEKRVKVFEIQRNEDDINKIISRVEECREYIKKLSI